MSTYEKELAAQAAGSPYLECEDATIRTLIRQLSAARDASKSWEGVFKANKKFVLEWLESNGTTGTQVDKITVSVTWNKGCVSLDKEALQRDYPEIDFSKYEKQGNGYQVFNIKEKK